MLAEPLTTTGKILFSILFLAGMGAFSYGIFYRLQLIRKAQPESLDRNLGTRLSLFFSHVVLQKKVFREPVRGIAHLFIYYGFLVYSLTTLNQFVEAYVDGFHLPFFLDPKFYVTAQVYAYTIDFFSVFVLAGIVFFGYRRYVAKSPALDRPSWQSLLALGMITIHMLSGMLMESATFALSNNAIGSPVRIFIASFLDSTNAEFVKGVQAFGWWVHAIAVLGFAAVVPHIKHVHLLFAPINIFLSRMKPHGQMSFINLEAENAVWGVKNVQDYTWKELLDGFACIECGRCTEQCPAFATGKPLNPKNVIINVRKAALHYLPGYQTTKAGNDNQVEYNAPLSPDYISDETMWSCTTCMACVQACPVGNNPMEKLTDTRRAKVLIDADFSPELQNTFTNMENQNNPWGLSADRRADWAIGLDVPLYKEQPDAEYLFWVGCAGSYDDRAKKVSVAFVKILKMAKVSFAILGTEERCSGDSARRGGNEYLFQSFAQANVDTMKQYGVRKIISICPHCYNTIKNEYPQFGGQFEVYHHTEFLQKLLHEERISLQGNSAKKVSYHDSCYLGRYNQIYQPPRDVLRSAGFTIAEAGRSQSRSFCCGAGGSKMWMEEKEPRINDNRTEELLQHQGEAIVVNCPFCLTMISDGVKNKDRQDEVKVKDLAEVVADALGL